MEIIYDEDLVNDVGDLSIVGPIIGVFGASEIGSHSPGNKQRIVRPHYRVVRKPLYKINIKATNL